MHKITLLIFGVASIIASLYFYNEYGKYVLPIILTVLFFYVILRPVKSKFSNKSPFKK